MVEWPNARGLKGSRARWLGLRGRGVEASRRRGVEASRRRGIEALRRRSVEVSKRRGVKPSGVTFYA